MNLKTHITKMVELLNTIYSHLETSFILNVRVDATIWWKLFDIEEILGLQEEEYEKLFLGM